MSVDKFNKRKCRVRHKLSLRRVAKCRLSVFKSHKHVYVQLIDDVTGHTIASASTVEKGFNETGTKTQKAAIVGTNIAKKALSLGISSIVFDRGGYAYHGVVKALAEAARQEELLSSVEGEEPKMLRLKF